jgi:hypothetical protein
MVTWLVDVGLLVVIEQVRGSNSEDRGHSTPLSDVSHQGQTTLITLKKRCVRFNCS